MYPFRNSPIWQCSGNALAIHWRCIGKALYIFVRVLFSVRPIVRTSLTAFVCASDYDDRTQFHMFEQKNEHV